MTRAKLDGRLRSRPRSVTAIAVLLTLAACGSTTARTGDEARQADAQFVVRCALSHVAFDDPLVLPGNPGKSHLHLFFGNRAVDHDPTYNERVLSAETTCEEPRDTASYWAPALLDEAGKMIDPLGLTAYYRAGAGVDPADVVAYPEGLMIIGGDQQAVEQSADVAGWSCGSTTVRESRPPVCGEGSMLRMLIEFPDCWDGNRLTAFGSSAHMRYSDDGCPATHPVALPRLTVAVDYPPVDPGGLSLSSGSISTAHADFWNVWDQAKLEREVDVCITRGAICSVAG